MFSWSFTFLISFFLTILLVSKFYIYKRRLPPEPWPLPIIGNLHILGSLPHRTLTMLAQKYGPIMTLHLGNVTAIVVSSPEHAELFLKQHDVITASRPTIQAWPYGRKSMAFAPYGDYWKQAKAVCVQHVLNTAKVDGFEWQRRREIEAVVNRLRADASIGAVVDLGKSVQEVIEGIMFEMLVGKHGKMFDIKGVVEEVATLAGAFNLNDFIPLLAPLDLQGMTRKVKVLHEKLDDILEQIIEEHLKDEDLQQKRNIVTAMLAQITNNTNDVKAIPSSARVSVKAIMFDMFAGGIDTTTITITWAISALIKHPRVMKLVQAELHEIIGKSKLVNQSDLHKLTYLDMVIKETLRLYPAGPLGLPHEITEDITVGKYMIPKKSRFMLNIWAISRNPEVWENVEEFYPERFVDKDIDVRGIRNFEMLPFGSGRRGCPGIYLGYNTVKLVVATLVHSFDWQLPNGMLAENLDMSEKSGVTAGRAKQLLVVPYSRF